MAEKEERVFVATLKTEDIDEYCVYGRDCITRQEAVERMAKAICLCDDDGDCKGKCNPKCDTWKYSIPHAEAALNALLS